MICVLYDRKTICTKNCITKNRKRQFRYWLIINEVYFVCFIILKFKFLSRGKCLPTYNKSMCQGGTFICYHIDSNKPQLRHVSVVQKMLQIFLHQIYYQLITWEHIFNSQALLIYSGPCILRYNSFQLDKYGLKLRVVLKWRDIYIKNIRAMSLMFSFKMEGIIKLRGLKS